MINAETQLMYSSDYPHWDFDLPSTIYDLPFLNEQAKKNILARPRLRCSTSNVQRPSSQRSPASRRPMNGATFRPESELVPWIPLREELMRPRPGPHRACALGAPADVGVRCWLDRASW